jgi:hypothetical protein
MTTITRKNAKKNATVPAAVVMEAVRFPKRSDFFYDFPTRASMGLPALDAKKSNAAGVSQSWSNAKVREARTTKHGVKVSFDGKTTEYKSVAAAFRELRLPFEKHIKFRLGLKASGAAHFENGGKLYAFALVDFEELSDAIRI